MTYSSILLIDDNDDYRDVAKCILESAGHLVAAVPCPHDAWQLLPLKAFDLILCDLHMPFIMGERQPEFEVSFNVGIATIRELMDLFPGLPIVGISNVTAEDLWKIRATIEGITVVPKPYRPDELRMLAGLHLGVEEADSTEAALLLQRHPVESASPERASRDL